MDIRTELWKKLGMNDRNFKWFHKNYLSDSEWHYNTLYQQAKGEILKTMSSDLEKAINEYIGE